MPVGEIIHIQTDKYSMILGQSYTYRNLGQGTIESTGSQPISVKRQNDKWLITYTYKMNKDNFAILWGVGSFEELVDFGNESQRKIWAGYDLDKEARLSLEGYYYPHLMCLLLKIPIGRYLAHILPILW